MRFLLLLSLVLVSCSLMAQKALQTLPEDADMTTYLEALEDYMTHSGNKQAAEAFVNFSGAFTSGGFTEAQQRTIRETTLLLAKERIRNTGAFRDYLELTGLMLGSAEEENPLFASFHDAFLPLLRRADVRTAEINGTIGNAYGALTKRRYGADPGATGWLFEGGGPRFRYEEPLVYMYLDTVQRLLAVGKRDTLIIEETDLKIDLANNTMHGRGGRTDWQRHGLNPEVFVVLVSYDIDLGRMLYEADTAHLQYPDYFENDILVGKFADKVEAGGARAGGEYPQFISSEGFVEVKNVGEGIDLRGNFELRGRTVHAIGSPGRKAEVTLDVNASDGRRQVHSLANRFTIKSGQTVSGQSARTTIYFNQDSLAHPSVTLRVDIPQRVAQLIRTKSSADQTPFLHSQNNMAIYADRMDVYLDRDSVVVGRKSVANELKSDVVFESRDYFNAIDYDRLRTTARSNPLDIIYAYRYGPEGGNDVIDANVLSKKFGAGFTAGNIQPMLFTLQSEGFIRYDSDSKEVTLLPKLAHYVRASREQKDFDRLRLVSTAKGTNAYMDLKSGEVRIDAVKPVQFNREKEIALIPLGDQLTMKGDRDFDFDGKIYAGGMVFEGKDFHFKYDPYYIELDSVRYLDLFLPVDDVFGEGMKRVSTGSRIEHLSGYLLIDAPRNKSGTEDIAYFPSLQSKSPSFIFYDGADTTASYNREEFYFELQPFSLNGLDSLTNSELELGGKLYSGGIFPDMEETLTVQEDGSLGFVTTTAEGGQGAYGERGNYEGEVSLSNRGLEGKGRFTYLEAEIDSEDLSFQLDRTTASAQTFALEETEAAGRAIPQVQGSEVNIEFRPYADSLIVNSAEDAPFAMFKAGQHQFDGGLVLTPEALKANGSLIWDAATMTSDNLDFGIFSAHADTADVAIKSIGSDDRLALETTDVVADVDFNTQVASFENNSTNLSTSLPYNQFKTSIDRFDWNMAGGNVTFKAKPGKDRFTSTHPDQDELSFIGTDATYDINTSVLGVQGVPFVRSADAKIFPDSGLVFVEPGAKVRELTNARIVADTSNEYHVINRAVVQISGRKDYTATGFYEYNVGPHEQEVEFQNIVGARVGKGKRNEKATATRAEGEVPPEQNFFVDHKTGFYGTINLDARDKKLLFEGYAKIQDEKLPGTQWFTIRSEGDKKNLALRVKEPKDRDGLPLGTGIYLSKPNRQIYPSFVQTLDMRKDHPILDCNELMLYDEARDVFLFGDSSRVYDPSLIGGNLMELDLANEKVTGDGRLGLGGRLKYISMKAYGSVATDLPQGSRRPPEEEPVSAPEAEAPKEEAAPSMFVLEDETATEKTDSTATDDKGIALTVDAPLAPNNPEVIVKAMAAIDLILPNKMVNMMATDIISGAYAAPGLNVVSDKRFYQAGLETLFADGGKDKAEALTSLDAAVLRVPDRINKHTFLFSRLNMKWSADYQSFVTTEKLSGLVSIKGNPIAKMLEVHCEVKMTSSGEDRLYLYVKSPSDLYYFFGFKDGILNVVSNNLKFMDELESMKPKDLVQKMDDGETYEILPVSPGTAQTFLRRVENAF